MEKIIIQKQNNIRKDGKMVRIAKDIDARLEEISEDSGVSKTRVTDLLLRKALEVVVIAEEVNL